MKKERVLKILKKITIIDDSKDYDEDVELGGEKYNVQFDIIIQSEFKTTKATRFQPSEDELVSTEIYVSEVVISDEDDNQYYFDLEDEIIEMI